jgi:hypothetical protein
MMPMFISLLLQGLYLVATSVVGQWLFGLGVGFVAYTGFSTMTSSVFDHVSASMGGLSSQLAGILHLMGVLTSMNIVLSGVAAKYAIAGAGSATVKRLAFK